MAVTKPFPDVARMATELPAGLAVKLLPATMASDLMTTVHFFRMNPPPLHTAGYGAEFLLPMPRILYERLAALLADITVFVLAVKARLIVIPSAKGFYGVHGKGEHLGNFPVSYRSYAPISSGCSNLRILA